MSELNLNFQDVINDLAEQVKRLTIDNAVLRAALQASHNHTHSEKVENDSDDTKAE